MEQRSVGMFFEVVSEVLQQHGKDHPSPESICDEGDQPQAPKLIHSIYTPKVSNIDFYHPGTRGARMYYSIRMFPFTWNCPFCNRTFVEETRGKEHLVSCVARDALFIVVPTNVLEHTVQRASSNGLLREEMFVGLFFELLCFLLFSSHARSSSIPWS